MAAMVSALMGESMVIIKTTLVSSPYYTPLISVSVLSDGLVPPVIRWAEINTAKANVKALQNILVDYCGLSQLGQDSDWPFRHLKVIDEITVGCHSDAIAASLGQIDRHAIWFLKA
jgi:hypothetical protein